MESDERDEADDEFLPEHTKFMRGAMNYCLEWMYPNSGSSDSSISLPIVPIDPEIAKAALTLPEHRRQALEQFWKSGLGQQCPIPIIDTDASDCPSALEFRQRFQNGNLPCLLRSLDTTCFASVCSKWRRDATIQSARNGGTKSIHRDWFRNHIGNDTTVPVRYQSSSSPTTLDDDGRAKECETKDMTLSKWIDLLDQAEGKNDANSTSRDQAYGEYYLKDWHLQSHLLENFHTDPLYQVPAFFQYDLLNSFLTKFTEKGDYMFTYWGPSGSRTSLHSDVLNSFSWSFNVSGTKEWKFYPPTLVSDYANDSSSAACVTIIQHSGECIFVSSGWKHEVKNLEETLSINHNWITTANMDLTWDCMCLEMKAIESELKAWGLPDDCWDSRESMLRGGCGLDVTAYFFMLLTRLLELLFLNKEDNMEGIDAWQLHFDLVRLKKGLQVLLLEDDLGLIGLEKRLEAVVQSKISAMKAIELAKRAIECVCY